MRWALETAAAVWLAVAATAMAMAPSGDPVRGGKLYAANCGSCHSLDANRVGPAHRGVYGRKAGTARGYAYSPAMHSARIVWNEATLDKFLTSPQTVVPGTKMTFGGLKDADKRKAVIAYLKSL